MKFLSLFFLTLLGCSQPESIPEDRERYGYFYDHFKDIDQIKSAMKDKNFDVNALYGKDYEKTTLLHWAAYNDDLEMVKFLLESGANPTAYDDVMSLAIPLAETTSPEVAELFLKKGVNVDQGSYMHDLSPLHIAVKRCDVEMVKFYLKHGADPNRTIAHVPAETPLCLAFRGIENLLRTDMPREVLFPEKSKPSRSGYLEIIKLLVENGADVNKACEWGEFSPMKAAIALGDKDIIDLLRKHGAK
jgi:ankyrin repeat protein